MVGMHALYTLVLTRLRLDGWTRSYLVRRTAEGLRRREIVCCLQRYVAHELYQVLVSLPCSPRPSRLMGGRGCVNPERRRRAQRG